MSSHHDMTPYDSSREPDFWSDTPAQPATGPSPLAYAPARADRRPDPVERLRRLLRGRTTLAVVLAGAGALVGAALGWMSQTVVYEAEGSVRIPTVIPVLLGKAGEPVTGYRQFMQTEAHSIRGLEMAMKTVERPEWKEVVKEPVPPAIVALNTDAKFTDQDFLIRIFFRNEKPDVALAGAKAVTSAYAEQFRTQRSDAEVTRGRALESQITRQLAQLASVEQKIEAQREKYDVATLDEEQGRLIKERAAQEEATYRAERDLIQARNQQELVTKNPEMLPVTDLAAYDNTLFRLLNERTGAFEALRGLWLGGAGPNNPTVRQYQRQVADYDTQIEEHAKRVRALYFGAVPDLDTPGGTLRMVTPAYLQALQDRRATAEQQLGTIAQRLNQISADNLQLVQLNDEAARLRLAVQSLTDQASAEQGNSEFQAASNAIRVNLPLEGTARVFEDKRPTMAAGGAILGFGLPLAVVLALGLLDSRFRYSDDAAEAGDRATLLGILPNLPDRLSDPNQASIAAHCVHQIRTMLQINHGSDEPRAFAVTSAQRGDGKTSLALALGLSYAASGARTLLVDTDLQHGGLSARLGVAGDEGIMDALTGAELMDVVCETDVTDLAILPIGRAGGNHAGAFSPGAVRHLIDGAKRHFDVIVCDTGPILGSIEATPIASSVDGVLVTVSRGQSRPLVTKALAHLESVSATLAGLVFNRAQASDFERSVSGMNLRSGPATRLPGGNTNGKGTGIANRAANGRRNVLSQN